MRERWDAGEIGCGALVFEVHKRISRMAPGDQLELIAHGAGTATDLEAWCRSTGHTLISANPPIYVIERTGE